MEVTDKDVYWACKIGRITRDEPSQGEMVKMRRVLEWFAKERVGEPGTVPDGHKIVPLLPTAEMLDAAADAFIGFSGEDEADAVWNAMLAAAPNHST